MTWGFYSKFGIFFDDVLKDGEEKSESFAGSGSCLSNTSIW